VVTEILTTLPVDFKAVFGAKSSDEVVSEGRLIRGIFDQKIVDP
jgi:hypothetical protein